MIRRGYTEPVLDTKDSTHQPSRLEVRPGRTLGGWCFCLTGLALGILVLPVCLPFLTVDLPKGHDTLGYLPKLVEFHENVRHGTLLPRWAPDLSFGHGQPLFLFSPPVFYYLAELWHLAGLNPVLALNATCMLLIFFSAWALYLLAEHWFGRWGGWLGATAYVYAPYFHVDLFTRRALAEFTAFAFYPLALYGFDRFARDRDGRFLLVGAFAYAGVILSHLPAALLFSPVLVAFVVFRGWREASWPLLRDLAGGLTLSLALAAGCWLPILVEMRHTQVGRLLEGFLHYSNHFVHLHQLFFSPWGYGLSVAGLNDKMSFSLGWSHLVLIVPAALGAWKWSGNVDRGRFLFFTGTLVVLCAFTLPGSQWFWEHLPLLHYVEFPWRLLAAATLCVALLVASAGPLMSKLPFPPVCVLLALALLILPNLSHIGPYDYLRVDLKDWTPDQIAWRGVAVTTKTEFQPIGVQITLPFREDLLRLIEGQAIVKVIHRTPTAWWAAVKAQNEVLIEVAVNHFPGWTVVADDKKLPIEAAAKTGLIRFRLPPGEHLVEGGFRRTPVRWIGEGISLVSAFLCLGYLWRRQKRTAKAKMKQ